MTSRLSGARGEKLLRGLLRESEAGAQPAGRALNEFLPEIGNVCGTRAAPSFPE